MKVKSQNSKGKSASKKLKVLTLRSSLLFFTFYFLLFTLVGCEAFVRKFTRKPKNEKPEEMVLAPEEWKGPKMTKEERYRQYYLFWQSWQDELISALSQTSTQKKKNDCIQQAVKNLSGMKSLLNESKQKQMDVYLRQIVELQGDINRDVYGNSIDSSRREAEKLKMNIMQNMSYNDIKNDLL